MIPILAAVALAPAVAGAQLASQLVVSGLSRPVAFVQHPTLPGVQLIVEQGGRIRTLQAGVLAGDFLDLTAAVDSSGERGLLGLAFAPDFASSRRVFVCFTNTAGHTVVARYRQPTDAVIALDTGTRFDLAWPGGSRFIIQPFANHNGGHLAFGPDGYLYVGLGDGGSGNDPLHLAQDPTTLLGKMLRLDVSVPDADAEGYDVPADNPFVGVAGTLPEIWAFGLRNPWRYSFDDPARGGTGALVLGDVGQGAWEEIDYEPAGQGGRNYGWRNREGAHNHITSLPAAYGPLTDPIWEYDHSTGRSVTGGYVYRGSALGGAYQGRYFFGDFSFGRVWSVALTIVAGGEAIASDLVEHTTDLGAGAAQPASFGVDAGGELYVVNYSGTVHRIITTNPGGAGNLIQNGDFSGPLQADGTPTSWTRYATPSPGGIVIDTSGGRLNFQRVPGSTQAVVFQNTGAALALRAPMEAAFDLGNSDAVRKRISVVIHDEDFSDLAVCTFWLDPSQPLRQYVMRTHTTEAWTGATVSFYAADAGPGFYELDNVVLTPQPSQSAERTDCVDPNAPAGGGTTSANLMTNGAFSAAFPPWTLYGAIAAQVVSGVAEFFRLPGTPAGVLLQATGAPMAQDQPMLATFMLGNSSNLRQRVTVLLHKEDFSDLHACTFYLLPNLPLSPYGIRTYASTAWSNATIAFYPVTTGSSPTHEWLRLDDVQLTRVAGPVAGTECLEVGASP